MDAEIADIWDMPVAPSSPKAAPPANGTPKRRTTLFLSDSEDDTNSPSKRKSASPQPRRTTTRSKPPTNIDALFDDLDDDDGFKDLAPSLDFDALQRQAEAEAAKKIAKEKSAISSLLEIDDDGAANAGPAGKQKGKDEEEGEKKKRKPIPRLDETRLLSSEGFPALLKEAKKFKPKGKGHEASDLNRLLQVYQFWSHRMYPKTQFRDTVQRVEKLCHSKRMHVALSVWHDEFHGLTNGRKRDDPIDLTSDDEQRRSSGDEDTGRRQSENPPAQRNSPNPGPTNTNETTSPRPSTTDHPPPAATPAAKKTVQVDDDYDMDAMIAEDEMRMFEEAEPEPPSSPPAQQNLINPQPSTSGHPSNATADDDEDYDAMWNDLDAGGFDYEAALATVDSSTAASANKPTAPSRTQGEDDDEEMWDMVRELEKEEAAKNQSPTLTSESAPPPAPGRDGEQDAPRATNDEGWDEMYA
ncbi:Swi3-domain-containing protein [Panus rudis PR-1116 ss-1]|nr:Swi3-domain-containing protein [Panus rudis PR-1116 ss-1]